MYRLFITYLIIAAFLSQNIAWAGGNNLLARDSSEDLEEMGALFRKTPGPEDGRWGSFSGKPSKGSSMPFHINPARLAEFHTQFGNFGPIEGDIEADGKCYFPMPAELVERLKGIDLVGLKLKLDSLIENLQVFGPGTRVRIITDSAKSLFYNKDDDVLEIHAIFLLNGIPDSLLHFCGRHEAMHKLIKGVSPLLEEVLNIYMDFEYLDSMNPQEAVNLISELGRLEGGGYSQILRKRFFRTRGLKEQDDLLDEVLQYIWNNCPWIIEGLNLGDLSQIREPVLVLRRYIHREIEDQYSFIYLLQQVGRYLENDFPKLGTLSPSQFISQIPLFLYRHIDIFSRLEEDIHVVSHRLEKGLDKDYVRLLQEYIRNKEKRKLWDELQEELRKKPLILDRDIRRFIEGIWYSIPKHELQNCIYMVRAGASQWVIAAGLASKVDPKILERLDIPKDKRRHILELISNYRRICTLLDHELSPANHMIQNAINLIIQLTRGDPDVLMLALLDKIGHLRRLSYDPRDYDDLGEKGQALLRQAVEWLYIPLAGFLGREDLAAEMAELYLMTILGGEYQLWEEEVGKLARVKQKDLPIVMKRIVDITREAIEDLPIEVSSRVKSPYAIYYKSREILDIFGIRFVIKGRHSPEEERRIRMELFNRLQGLFSISKSDRKRFREKQYNEYDFIAGLNPKLPGFQSLLSECGVKEIYLEVQIYPTENDLQRYRYGPTAHWLYKLEAVLKSLKKPLPKQFFDRDILDRLYMRFKEGDFDSNFRLVYEELSRWRVIGVLSDDKIKMVRAVPESIPPDIASADSIDLFKRGYIGLRRFGAERILPNTVTGELTPDIYEVVSGKGLKEEELMKIRDKTRKPRTYVFVMRMLGNKPKEEEGRRLLEGCLEELEAGINSGYLESNLFNIEDKDSSDTGLVQKGFSLRSLGGLYQLLVLVNQPEGQVMLRESIRRAYAYMTGEYLGDVVDIAKLKERWGIRSKEPVSPLVYLFTIAEKGKQYLKENGFDPENYNNRNKLHALLDYFNVDNLLQLFGRIGLDREVLGRMILLRLRSISPPRISISLEDPSNTRVQEDIQDVMDRSGLDIWSSKIQKDKMTYHVKPDRYWLDRMDMILQEVRSIDGVEGAELIYEEPNVVAMRFGMDIQYRNMDRVEVVIEELFRKLGIDYNQTNRTRQRFGYNISVPKRITAEELEGVARLWLKSRLGADAKITKLSIRPVDKKPPPHGAVLGILVLLLPCLLGANGSLGIVGYTILGIVGMLAVGMIAKGSIEAGTGGYPDAGAMADRFLSVVRSQADACRLSKKELVLAIDTDIGNLKDCADELFRELAGLEDRFNVRILIGRGADLKVQIDSYLRDAERSGKGFVVSAVLKADNLGLYEDMKDKISITAVSDTVSPIYIPIISILELSIKRAMGERIERLVEDYSSLPNVKDVVERDGILTIILLPKAEPISIEQLGERYKQEAQALSSA